MVQQATDQSCTTTAVGETVHGALVAEIVD